MTGRSTQWITRSETQVNGKYLKVKAI